MNNFHIEPGTPEHCTVDGGLARDLGDAIQAAFPLETEDAQLVWHRLSVPLSYKYDFSVIIEDIIAMLAYVPRKANRKSSGELWIGHV